MDSEETKQLIKWQKRTALIKVIYFTIIVLLLIYVGWKAGGDPCMKCRLKGVGIDPTKEYNCRELINITLAPILTQPVDTGWHLNYTLPDFDKLNRS